ncbi:hypothetical protein [Cellulomonas edaphi]|uniref:Peptidase M10 metallopeptidase domain-containing protein n=1 Tax=Cellulomonas edaphi TaxID=3053468 RepID=A0ABT7S2W8_9CELL|nr:hypothetical protein [Cellulomons edaphi]MDM7829965.1 hypothetical protein [Cellulomons edaphi]
MRHRRALRAVGIGAAGLLAVAAVQSPAAASYYSGGMPSRTFSVRPVGINDVWIGYLDSARGYWNATAAGTHLTRTSTSKNTYTAGRWSYSWGGRYTPSGSGSSRTFTIEVNVQYLQARAGDELSRWCLSTTTHELGHGLKLADNPSTTKASLMKYDRDPAKVYKPTAYDVSEVVKYA